MSKPNSSKNSSTKALEKSLEKSTKDWRSAKKRERAARNALAAIVNEAVGSGVMSENKVASITAIPRMTIRKMLGKDDLPAEAVDIPRQHITRRAAVFVEPTVELVRSAGKRLGGRHTPRATFRIPVAELDEADPY